MRFPCNLVRRQQPPRLLTNRPIRIVEQLPKLVDELLLPLF
jgi:hypothetical protein